MTTQPTFWGLLVPHQQLCQQGTLTLYEGPHRGLYGTGQCDPKGGPRPLSQILIVARRSPRPPSPAGSGPPDLWSEPFLPLPSSEPGDEPDP